VERAVVDAAFAAQREPLVHPPFSVPAMTVPFIQHHQTRFGVRRFSCSAQRLRSSSD